MDAELQNAAKVIEHPKRPLTAIVGGAKVSDKIELISNLIDKCDHILIGEVWLILFCSTGISGRKFYLRNR